MLLISDTEFIKIMARHVHMYDKKNTLCMYMTKSAGDVSVYMCSSGAVVFPATVIGGRCSSVFRSHDGCSACCDHMMDARCDALRIERQTRITIKAYLTALPSDDESTLHSVHHRTQGDVTRRYYLTRQNSASSGSAKNMEFCQITAVCCTSTMTLFCNTCTEKK